MKILHINSNYLGSNPVHRTMMKHLLSNKAHENTYDIFVPIKNNIQKENNNIYAIKCFSNADRLFYYIKQKKILTAIEEKLQIQSYDCIHAFTLFTDGNIAYKLHKKYGVKYIVAIRGTDIDVFLKYRPYLKKRAKIILEHASYIVFLSNAYKDAITKILYSKMGYPHNNKTVIIPNGIDDFWMKHINNNKKNAKNREDVKAIFVGKINKRKNITTAIKAIEILNINKKAILTIVGKIEDKKIYNSFKDNPLVNYVGEKKKEELINLYRKHDVFIMPSHTETFGLVYAEAITQGLPVIYTKGQGFDEQFKEGTVGYHVSDTSPKDIVEAINKISHNYESIQLNCTNECQKFNWDNICETYYQLYASIKSMRKKK